MMMIKVSHNVNDLVDWFKAQGYPIGWYSNGWTYEGLHKEWRIERTSAIPRGWTVGIRDEKLFTLFALRWS
jgi:hypothetical protein